MKPALCEASARVSSRPQLRWLTIPVWAPIDDIIRVLADEFEQFGFRGIELNYIASKDWTRTLAAPPCELEEEFQAEQNIEKRLLELRDDLDRMRLLPQSWFVACLKAAGGQGSETFSDLRLALSPRPRMPNQAVTFLAASEADAGARHKRRLPPEWARQVLDKGDAGAAWQNHHEQIGTWEDAKRYMKLALAMARGGYGLQFIEPSSLRLIDATDDELEAEAERKVHELRALNAARIERNQLPLHKRELDLSTHRRRLRREAKRAAAWAAGILKLVGGPDSAGTPLYADDWTLARWRDLQRKSRAWIERHDIVAEDGRRIPLPLVVDMSRASRCAMWYSIVIGLRERARRVGYKPYFITCTLPPEWHSNPKNGKSNGDPSLSPHAGAKELGERWTRVRALLRKRGVDYFGIRTAEPHGDGTPHLHLLLWMHPDFQDDLEEAFRLHFPAAIEGCDDIACKIKVWEERPKSEDGTQEEGISDPASYIMHYVLKHVRSSEMGDEGDEADEEASTAGRARAWASFVGLRRLSLVGLARGTLGKWRAAFTLMKSGEKITCQRTKRIVRAMRHKHWTTALFHLGAFAKNTILGTISDEKIDRWGEVTKTTYGWFEQTTGEIALIARPIQWRIEESTSETGVETPVSDVVSFPSKWSDTSVAGADPPADLVSLEKSGFRRSRMIPCLA
jgi:hypothetical protein